MHLMREVIYMSKILVNLEEEKGKAFLVFNFDSIIKIELTSDEKENLRLLFEKILENIIKGENISFSFVDQGKTDLYTEVSKKYINDLELEVETIKKEFLNPIEEEI